MNQIQKILDSPIEKEQQANIKSRIRNNKKIVYSNKRLSKEIKNINTPDPRIQNQFLQLQIQSQKIQPIPIIKNSLPQKPNLIISQKSYTSNRFPTTIANKNNMWLNKYFIYRHDSLNRYITIKEFKASLEKLPENYNKLIYQYNRFRKQIINKQINDTNNLSQNKGIENKNINSNLTNTINNQKKKNFIVTGGYADVVKNLTDRGWVKENNIKSLEFDYIWTLKTNEINFIQLNKNQMTNHYFRNGQITRKSGLSKNIKNLYYLGIDPMNFFPRCYDLSVKNELEDFKQDFKFTWTISLLILFQKEANEKGNTRTTSQQFTTEVIETAINIIQRHLFLLEPNGALRDINNLRNGQSPSPIVHSQNENVENDENNKERERIQESTNEKPREETASIAAHENQDQNQIKEFVETKTLFGHTEKVTAIIQLNSGKLATGGYDNKIRIWDIYDAVKNQEDKIIDEDGRIFVLLEFLDGKILSGTSKNKINLWDLNSDSTECEYSFEGHELWVNCLVKIDNKTFASASNDAKIKVWDFYSHYCLMELAGHTDCILSLVLLQTGKFCSGSADTSIKIWDREKKECIQTLTGHEKWVKCVFELDNGIIVSGSDDNSIKLWKPNSDDNYTLLYTIEEHTHSVRTFCQVDRMHFASGSFDKTIKIWEFNTWKCVQTLVGHTSNIIGIINLKMDGKQAIASCSNDKSIRIWEKDAIYEQN